ncbi:hypothetical protein PR202_ga15741 [Eleusine coracana subsp. coracana]|uniref:SAM domain-containing protein n=1 Tax=Eleusine coracana subsp. coracana TaxID=191504 RepID=A0AAV5CKZ1_ELECO|nr:hypothetical protein PR202_ga15741 [Eleusine coracana subsp. coracana]
MPAASRKFSAKPAPSPAAASRPKATVAPFHGGCDDDDDFVSPPPASRARPLKPCNGNNGAASRRPCKKLKPSYPNSAKENRSVSGGVGPAEKVSAAVPRAAETLAAGSRVNSGAPEGKGTMVGEIPGLSRCVVDGSKTGRNVKKVSDRYGKCKSNFSPFPNSSESRILVLGDVCCDLGGGDIEEAQAVDSGGCTSIPDKGQATAIKVKGFVAPEGENRSRLVEARFLESAASYESLIADSYDSEGLGPGMLASLTDNLKMEKESGLECGFGIRNGNHDLHPLESSLIAQNVNHDSGGDCKQAQDLDLEVCNLVSQERKVAAGHCTTLENETVENKLSEPGTCKENYCSNSSESELLQSQIPHDFEGDGSDNFEIGTQLSELINLCMEDHMEGHSNCRESPVKKNTCDSKCIKSDNQVLCPLCGSDISDLSEECRQLHTNNCLDEPAKESNLNHENEHSAAENVENKCVVEWLRELGLSKYEKIFIKEEIDWETLQWLTEEDLLGMGITSLGPRKKIIHALGEMRKKKDDVNDMEADLLNPESSKTTKLPMNGNKLITEYFQCSSSDQRQRRVCKVNKPSNMNEQKNSSAKIAPKRSRAVKGKVKDTPLWCCIPGTPFRVISLCSTDYQGLTRSFCHGKIYCSSITASLVHHKIGISWDRLYVLPMNEKVTVAGVNLTCFDANHCPGSIIILFEPPNGKAVLHTGDFRFSSEMATNTILQSSHIHTLILDTTYCNPRYDFPSQEVVIQFVIEAIQAEAFNPKTLFLIGSYTIGIISPLPLQIFRCFPMLSSLVIIIYKILLHAGKERLFMEVARLLQKKIYVGAAKLQILKHLELPQEIMHWFTANEAESHIHVVPMWTLASFKRMKFLSNQYAVRPSKKRTPGKRWQQGSIIRYEVPYSEHSSFTELQEFVKFISPEHMIPSVNNDGPESADAMLAKLLNE